MMELSSHQERERCRSYAIKWLLGDGYKYDDDLVILYQMNVYFKTAIEMLVQMLPQMAKGFAIDAEKRQREIDQAVEMARRVPPVGAYLMPEHLRGDPDVRRMTEDIFSGRDLLRRTFRQPEDGVPPGPGR